MISHISHDSNTWEMDLKDFDAVIDTTGEEKAWKRSSILKPDGSFVTINSFDVGFDPNGHPPRKYAAFYCLCNKPSAQDAIAKGLEEGTLKIPLVEPTYPFTEQGAKDMLIAQA